MSFSKKDFARFLLEEKILLFGEFTLKSGRQSPHFFNSGCLDNGRALDRFGQFMAQRLQELGGGNLIFGPAYKGIPLAVAVATAYYRLTGEEIGFLFNRKEAKKHAEGGLFVGRSPGPQDRIILVDDVISSGMSLKEACDLLQTHFQVKAHLALVCVDRQERGQESEHSASNELKQLKGVSCEALVTLEEVIHLMAGEKINDEVVITPERQEAVIQYLQTYGSLQRSV